MINDANHVSLSPISFLARARRAFPARTAVIDGDGSEVSYADLAADCDALAGALRTDGVRPGDRVAVLDLNTRWLLAAHFGVPGAGAALVALNSRLAPADYQNALRAVARGRARPGTASDSTASDSTGTDDGAGAGD
jgi:fatty-acyl-CoA synthase